MGTKSLGRRFAATVVAAVCIAPMLAGTAAASEAPVEGPDTAVSVTVNEDGSTTLLYEDGATFTSGGGIGILSGSFDWDATYSAGVFSRTWTTGRQGDIWVNVDSISDCGVTQRLTLYKDTLTDPVVGTVRTVSCDGGKYVWRDVPSGDYYFYLSDPNTSDKYFPHDAKGSVGYQ